MNRRLLDPFQAIVALPDVIEEYLEHQTPLCLAFNRRGTLLAVGTEEGNVVIWDFETRSVASEFSGHSEKVCSVCWSRNGRYLASGSADASVKLWDVLTGEQMAHRDVGAEVCQVSLSGRPPYRCLVSLAEGAPQLVNFTVDEQQVVPLLPDDLAMRGGSRPESAGNGSVNGAPALLSAACAVFTRNAEMVVVAHARGSIAVMDAKTLRYLDVIKVPGSARVTSLTLNRKATLLLANCSDRVLRLYDIGQRSAVAGQGWDEAELRLAMAAAKATKVGSQLCVSGGQALLTPVRDFQNAVERMAWKSACFSGDSEFVVAVQLSRHREHHLYVWNRHHGNMERILEGPAKEGGLEVAWHPQRSLLLSVSTGGASPGRVLIWSKVYTENWSAFAPDFQELEENREYAEREDEFDWAMPAPEKEEAAQVPAGGARGAEQPWVDVMTVDEPLVFSSDADDEDPDELHDLPAAVQPEEGLVIDKGDAGGGEDGSDDGDGGARPGGSDSGEAEDNKDSESLGVSGPRKRKVKFDDDFQDPGKGTDEEEEEQY